MANKTRRVQILTGWCVQTPPTPPTPTAPRLPDNGYQKAVFETGVRRLSRVGGGNREGGGGGEGKYRRSGGGGRCGPCTLSLMTASFFCPHPPPFPPFFSVKKKVSHTDNYRKKVQDQTYVRTWISGERLPNDWGLATSYFRLSSQPNTISRPASDPRVFSSAQKFAGTLGLVWKKKKRRNRSQRLPSWTETQQSWAFWFGGSAMQFKMFLPGHAILAIKMFPPGHSRYKNTPPLQA